MERTEWNAYEAVTPGAQEAEEVSSAEGSNGPAAVKLQPPRNELLLPTDGVGRKFGDSTDLSDAHSSDVLHAAPAAVAAESRGSRRTSGSPSTASRRPASSHHSSSGDTQDGAVASRIPHGTMSGAAGGKNAAQALYASAGVLPSAAPNDMYSMTALAATTSGAGGVDGAGESSTTSASPSSFVGRSRANTHSPFPSAQTTGGGAGAEGRAAASPDDSVLAPVDTAGSFISNAGGALALANVSSTQGPAVYAGVSELSTLSSRRNSLIARPGDGGSAGGVGLSQLTHFAYPLLSHSGEHGTAAAVDAAHPRNVSPALDSPFNASFKDMRTSFLAMSDTPSYAGKSPSRSEFTARRQRTDRSGTDSPTASTSAHHGAAHPDNADGPLRAAPVVVPHDQVALSDDDERATDDAVAAAAGLTLKQEDNAGRLSAPAPGVDGAPSSALLPRAEEGPLPVPGVMSSLQRKEAKEAKKRAREERKAAKEVKRQEKELKKLARRGMNPSGEGETESGTDGGAAPASTKLTASALAAAAGQPSSALPPRVPRAFSPTPITTGAVATPGTVTIASGGSPLPTSNGTPKLPWSSAAPADEQSFGNTTNGQRTPAESISPTSSPAVHRMGRAPSPLAAHASENGATSGTAETPLQLSGADEADEEHRVPDGLGHPRQLSASTTVRGFVQKEQPYACGQSPDGTEDGSRQVSYVANSAVSPTTRTAALSRSSVPSDGAVPTSAGLTRQKTYRSSEEGTATQQMRIQQDEEVNVPKEAKRRLKRRVKSRRRRPHHSPGAHPVANGDLPMRKPTGRHRHDRHHRHGNAAGRPAPRTANGAEVSLPGISPALEEASRRVSSGAGSNEGAMSRSDAALVKDDVNAPVDCADTLRPSPPPRTAKGSGSGSESPSPRHSTSASPRKTTAIPQSVPNRPFIVTGLAGPAPPQSLNNKQFVRQRQAASNLSSVPDGMPVSIRNLYAQNRLVHEDGSADSTHDAEESHQEDTERVVAPTIELGADEPEGVAGKDGVQPTSAAAMGPRRPPAVAGSGTAAVLELKQQKKLQLQLRQLQEERDDGQGHRASSRHSHSVSSSTQSDASIVEDGGAAPHTPDRRPPPHPLAAARRKSSYSDTPSRRRSSADSGLEQHRRPHGSRSGSESADSYSSNSGDSGASSVRAAPQKAAPAARSAAARAAVGRKHSYSGRRSDSASYSYSSYSSQYLPSTVSVTSSSSSSYSSWSSGYSSSSSDDSVPRVAAKIPLKAGCTVPPPPRAFSDVPYRMAIVTQLQPYAEPAVIHEWNLREGCWDRVETLVVLSPDPFSQGNMRASYHMIDMKRLNCRLIVKRYLKASVDDDQYYDDVSMHSISGHWARLYNAANPPKKVKFVPAAVLELPHRSPPLILGMEPELEGTFRKYNNNCGYVPRDARWTPQAFSHFTHHASGGALIIVDIQGVGDIFTDPQILSEDGDGYGRGNLGHKGIARFFRTHRCNGVCRALGLPSVGASSSPPNPSLLARFVTPEADAVREERLPPKAHSKPTPVTGSVSSSQSGHQPRHRANADSFGAANCTPGSGMLSPAAPIQSVPPPSWLLPASAGTLFPPTPPSPAPMMTGGMTPSPHPPPGHRPLSSSPQGAVLSSHAQSHDPKFMKHIRHQLSRPQSSYFSSNAMGGGFMTIPPPSSNARALPSGSGNGSKVVSPNANAQIYSSTNSNSNSSSPSSGGYGLNGSGVQQLAQQQQQQQQQTPPDHSSPASRGMQTPNASVSAPSPLLRPPSTGHQPMPLAGVGGATRPGQPNVPKLTAVEVRHRSHTGRHR